MPVYQEKNKSKWTKDGRSWYFKCYYTDMYGNRKQKVSKMFKTKTESKEAENQFLVNIKKQDETDYNISFETVCYEWLNFKCNVIKSTTYYCLEKRVERHIISFFKNFKLHSIKINTLDEWKSNILSKNYVTNYLNTLITYLQEILQYAVENYDFDIKVANRLQKIRNEHTADTINNSEYNFWTYEEYQTFIEIVEDDFDKMLYQFLYYTGLRLGETIALKWKNIDFDRKTVKITKTFTNKVKDKVFDLIDPKTSNSIRTVYLDDNIVQLLKKHYENEKHIYNFNDNMFVFGNVKYISPTTFKNHLNKWIDKIEDENFKRITPHGFRHSHVSLLIHLGCDSRDVAERVGDTVQMIEKTYCHMFPEKKKHTVDVLNNLNLKIRGK